LAIKVKMKKKNQFGENFNQISIPIRIVLWKMKHPLLSMILKDLINSKTQLFGL
jgi:hypothetical protein